MNQELRQEVRERDGHECKFCEDTENLHTHHIVPRSAGGSDSKENLMTVCASCHNKIESTQGKALKRIKESIFEEALDSISKTEKEVKLHMTSVTNIGPDSIRHLSPDEEKAFEEYKHYERTNLREYKVNIEITAEDIKQAVREALPSGMFK